MKVITLQDCKDLYEKFLSYVELSLIHSNVDRSTFEKFLEYDDMMQKTIATITHYDILSIPSSQKSLNAMFRVVLGAMNEPFDEYMEEEEQ